MAQQKKLSDLSWGWISGTALGIGASLGVAWHSWAIFTVVSFAIALLMIWRAMR